MNAWLTCLNIALLGLPLLFSFAILYQMTGLNSDDWNFTLDKTRYWVLANIFAVAAAIVIGGVNDLEIRFFANAWALRVVALCVCLRSFFPAAIWYKYPPVPPRPRLKLFLYGLAAGVLSFVPQLLQPIMQL